MTGNTHHLRAYRSWPRRQVLLMLAGGLAVLWSLVAWDYQRTEDQALEQIRRETSALAMVFANHAETTFRDVDHTILILRDAWLVSPARFTQELTRHHDLLDRTAIQVVVIDAAGFVAYTDRGVPKEPLFVGDREAFQVHQREQTDRLFISRPIQGRLSGKWTIQMTRPILANGQFRGVMVVAVDPGYFVKFYQEVGLGQAGAARMIRDTGEVMARSYDQDRHIGKVVNPSPYADPGAPQRGSFRRRAQVDGIDRLSSYFRLPERGVTVIIGPSVDEMLAPTRVQQRKMLFGAGLVTVLVALLSWQLLRRMASDEKSRLALAEQQERLALATVHNGVGIWDWNPQSGRMVWDESMFALHRLPREDLARGADGWQGTVHPDDLDRLNQELSASLSEGKPFSTEYRIRWPDGEIRHIKSIAKVFRDAQGMPERMLGTDVDITDRKQAEEARHAAEAHALALVEAHRDQLEARVAERTQALSKAKEAAEAANVAKSLFLANVSHELRTPLNHIVGMSGLVRREPLSDRQRERMDKLDDAAARLTGNIEAILELTKLEAGTLELAAVAVDIDGLLGATAGMYRDQAEAKDLLLTTRAEPMPGNLLGDPGRIQAALANLVDNAVRFTESGTISLRTALVEDGADHALIRFEVEDTGIGIAPDALPRLFSLFEQADNSSTRRYGGTGIGLAITQRLARAMGGDAGCDSAPGSGSTFWFTVRFTKAN